MIATASVAIAETGKGILDGSPLCDRRAPALLPDCLVCFVETAQVTPAGRATSAVATMAPLVSTALQPHDDRSRKALRWSFPPPYGSAHISRSGGWSNRHKRSDGR